jgi:hypothetical protein
MYRHRTLAALLLSAATIGLGIGVGTVSASPQELVDAAYKAMGLTNAVNTLVVKGRMHTWDPGESQDAYKPETGDFGVSTFTESAASEAARGRSHAGALFRRTYRPKKLPCAAAVAADGSSSRG